MTVSARHSVIGLVLIAVPALGRYRFVSQHQTKTRLLADRIGTLAQGRLQGIAPVEVTP